MSDQGNFGPQDFAPPPPPQPPPAQPVTVPPWAYPQPRRRGAFRRFLGGVGKLIFIVSILLNIYLLAALGAMAGPVQMDTTVLQPGNDTEVVAVYRLVGGIDENAVEQFRTFYRLTVHDGNIKAIVLRVDSPGGGAAAADQIHEMVRKLQTTGNRKVVVSMGSVAASGGYYISAAADEIFAENNTITGSIGVIMAWLVLKGTLDKIGMEAMVLKSSDAENWKDIISPFKRPDDRQRAALVALLNSVQKRFEDVVREGRGDRLKTRQETYTVTVGEGPEAQLVQRTDTVPLNGQVFTPTEAKELGLIDAIGFEDDAINRAGKLAGLVTPKVVLYEPHKGFLVRLLEGRGPTGVKIGPELLDELQTPRVLLMWKVE
jgi:signal peptide peptidase SppA